MVGFGVYCALAMILINVFKEIFKENMDGLQMILPRFSVAENLGVVLAGPGDATAFLVCRTLRLG